MSIAENLKQVLAELPQGVRLVAVSKFHPNEAIEEAYKLGCKEGKRKAMEGGMGFRDDDDDDDDDFRDMWRRGGEGFGERRGVRGTGRYAGEYRRRRR
mgnify:CR=1 FL=1